MPALNGIEVLDVAFGDGRFVAACGSGRVAVSTNGRDWTVALLDPSPGLVRVIFANGQFVATTTRTDTSTGQYYGVLAVSTDGLTWTDRRLDISSTQVHNLTWADGWYVVDGILPTPPSPRAVFVSSNLIS